MNQPLQWRERVRIVRQRLDIDQDEFGRRLGISREWVSKLERGKEEPSVQIQIKIDKFETDLGLKPSEALGRKVHKSEVSVNRGGSTAHIIAVEDAFGDYQTMLDRFQRSDRKPSTKEDCEAYVRLILDMAEHTDDPDIFPTVMSRLKKALPLDEWKPKSESE